MATLWSRERQASTKDSIWRHTACLCFNSGASLKKLRTDSPAIAAATPAPASCAGFERTALSSGEAGAPPPARRRGRYGGGRLSCCVYLSAHTRAPAAAPLPAQPPFREPSPRRASHVRPLRTCGCVPACAGIDTHLAGGGRVGRNSTIP
eukprot:scaffold420_cov404-Prasinococcus_capsulatus_cf.AAC.14